MNTDNYSNLLYNIDTSWKVLATAVLIPSHSHSGDGGSDFTNRFSRFSSRSSKKVLNDAVENSASIRNFWGPEFFRAMINIFGFLQSLIGSPKSCNSSLIKSAFSDTAKTDRWEVFGHFDNLMTPIVHFLWIHEKIEFVITNDQWIIKVEIMGIILGTNTDNAWADR